MTSLVVAWMSTLTIEAFLRAKIDQKFPAILHATAERLDLWYGQRELDVATFADSAIVAGSLQRMEVGDRGAAEARRELAQYLDYVLERFPQYDSLFVLDADGESLLGVGNGFELPRSLRQSLAGVASSQVGPLQEIRGSRVQLASTQVEDGRGRPLASLHALLRVEALRDVLRSDGLGPAGGIYVVDGRAGVTLRSHDAPDRSQFERAVPGPGDRARVEDYTHADGAHVVGSSVHFPRFGWTIVVEEAYDEAFAPVVAVTREIMAINLGIVLVFGLIAFQMARSIVRPILALSAAARRIAGGEMGVEIEEPTHGDEIGLLTRAFNEMSQKLRENEKDLERNRVEIEDANARLVTQNQELQRVNEVFQQLSITDDLTKLHNHRFFQDHLPREIKRSARTGEPLSLVLIDIDDFKGLNDRFGHAVGDAVLRKVADVMTSSVREMDLLARYGGEEFALLACNTALEGAVALAQKVRLAITRSGYSVVDLEGPKRIQITASFGVAEFRGDDRAFFNDADRALYRAKAAGKDCVVAADGDDRGSG